MGVESLVLFYGVVCAAMILFNCVCIYYFKRREQETHHISRRFAERIRSQSEYLSSTGTLRSEDFSYLTRKLETVKNLMSFDLALEELFARDSKAGSAYIKAIHHVFLPLGHTYLKRETVQSGYFLYLIVKYRVCSGSAFDPLMELMPEYMKKPGINCRYRALNILCQTGQEDKLTEALILADRLDAYLPEKLLLKLLVNFEGDSEKLITALLGSFSKFRLSTQSAIISFVSKKSDRYSEMFFRWLQEEPESELRYALLRYFGQHRYDPAHALLCSLVDRQDTAHWVDASISATVLRSYPGNKTIAVLKLGLSSPNWHVRYNSAESLEQLGITYNELSDIINGADRYAREMITYRAEHNNLKKEVVDA